MSANIAESDFRPLEKLFLALGDKTRLRLLALMADGEVPVGFLADRLGESQPKVSRHLAYLRNAGVVNTRRDGKWIYYGIEYPDDVLGRSLLETLIRSIAVTRIDGESVYLAETERYEKATDTAEHDIYVETDMYGADAVYKDDEDDYEQIEKREEIDVFLL